MYRAVEIFTLLDTRDVVGITDTDSERKRSGSCTVHFPFTVTGLTRDTERKCDFTILLTLERCNPWPHVANRHVSI